MDIITPEQAIEAAKGMTFEKYWALLMEDRKNREEEWRKFNKKSKKWEREAKKARAEYDKQRAELEAREAERRIKNEEETRVWREEMNRLNEHADKTLAELKANNENAEKALAEVKSNMGGINNTLGEITEYMSSPHLTEKFSELGYEVFTQCKDKEFKIGKKLIAEADVFIENGEYAIAVEIKTKLREEDVDKHIDRLYKIRECMKSRNDDRKLIGAIAAIVVSDNAKKYTFSRGLYLICQNGDSFSIADTPGDFKVTVV